MCGTMDATLLEPDTHRDADLRALVSELREEISQLRREVSELRCEAGYWKSRHADAVERNRKLQEELDQANAEICRLKADLFGRKSEKQSSTDRSNNLDDPQDQDSANKKKRGQQPNRPGPARRDYSHLPARETLVDVPPDEHVCDRCGKPLVDMSETDDSEQVEIEFTVYRRRIRRRRYRKTCNCPGQQTVTAPKPPKLIPKGRYGTSLWVHLLLEKFHTLVSRSTIIDALSIELIDGFCLAWWWVRSASTGGLFSVGLFGDRPSGYAR